MHTHTHALAWLLLPPLASIGDLSMAEDGLPPGFVFAPPDHALIKDVLRRKVAGLPINSRYNIHNFDAYSVPPDELVLKHEHAPGTDKNDGKGGYWYFFTPVRRHKTKNGVVGRRKRATATGTHGTPRIARSPFLTRTVRAPSLPIA
jgi:hypothetical protein